MRIAITLTHSELSTIGFTCIMMVSVIHPGGATLQPVPDFTSAEQLECLQQFPSQTAQGMLLWQQPRVLQTGLLKVFSFS